MTSHNPNSTIFPALLDSALGQGARDVDNARNADWLDRLAIGLSGLCVAHCLLSAVVVTLLASAGGALLHHGFHEVGLILAIGLGATALGRGVVIHGYAMPAWVGSLGLGLMAGALSRGHDGSELVFSILGVLVVALGHDLNRRATA